MGGRTFTIANLANKALSIVRELARTLPAAAAGERVDLRTLERDTAANGRGATLRTAGLLALMVVPGAIYALSYAR
jgi:hypothetical protein